MSNSQVFPFAARLPPGTPIRSAGYQWLEPYEGKLSRTVLRGGRAGNSSLPLDQPEAGGGDGVRAVKRGPAYAKLPSALRFDATRRRGK